MASAPMFRNYQFDPKDPAKRHTFEIHGMDLSIVNGIRRVVLTDIPVVGFLGEDHPSIDIEINTGRLHNELLSHRFGLIPIHLPEVDTDAYMDEEITVQMHVKNNTDSMMNVTTQHIDVYRNDKLLADRDARALFPVDPITKHPILITRLHPGEELKLKATAIKETARLHAGFCAVCLCTFHYMLDPVAADKTTNVLDRERAYLRNEYGDPMAIQFDIETINALTPRYLVHKALEIMYEKLSTLSQEIMMDTSDLVTHGFIRDKGFTYVIKNEDDTLGNLLQSFLHTHYVRGKANTPSGHHVAWAGYYCPHPLDSTVELSITLDENISEAKAYQDLMQDVCQNLMTKIKDIQLEWLRFTAT